MVPCSRISEVLDETKVDGLLVTSREEEALAIGAGLVLAGATPLVAMQASGLLNSLNSLGSLAVAYRLPLLLFVSMRGSLVDKNLTQAPGYRVVAGAV